MKLNFAVDYLKVLQEDDYVSMCEIDLLHDGKNNNGSIITKEAIEKSLPTVFNKPIICIPNMEYRETATEFLSHAKNNYEFNKILPIGSIPESCDAKISKKNNLNYLTVKAVIWKSYLPSIMDILSNKDGVNKVSVEIIATKSHKNNFDDLVIEEFNYMSVFLLADNIPTGMKNTTLQITKFSMDNIIKKGNEYFKEYDIPQEVKDTATKSLTKKNVNEKFATFAEMLVNENTLTYSQIGGLYKQIKSLTNKKSIDYFGGAFGKEWCENILEFEKEGGSKLNMDYFELCDKIYAALSVNKVKSDGYEYNRYYIRKIYETHIIAYDTVEGKLYKIQYTIDDKDNIILNMETIKDVEDDLKKFVLEDLKNFDISLKETKDKIEFSNELNKNSNICLDSYNLAKIVFESKDNLEIANKVYLKVDDSFKDGNPLALKYQVMDYSNGKLYYNQELLGIAKTYALINEDKEILDKIDIICQELKFSVEELDKFNKQYSSLKLVNSENDYIYNDLKFEEEVPIIVAKNDNIIQNEIENVEQNGCKDKDYEKTILELKDSYNSLKSEFDNLKVEFDNFKINKDKIIMSSDATVDTSAMIAYLEIEAKNNKELSDKVNVELATMVNEDTNTVVNYLINKLTEQKVELESLKNFKFEIEKEKIKNIINETIEIVKEDLSKEDLVKFEKEGLDYNLNNINEWVSKVKSFAYEVSRGTTLKNKKTYTNIGKWEIDNNVEKSLWDKPKK